MLALAVVGIYNQKIDRKAFHKALEQDYEARKLEQDKPFGISNFERSQVINLDSPYWVNRPLTIEDFVRDDFAGLTIIASYNGTNYRVHPNWIKV